MLKRIAPLLTVLLSVLLDTAVIPVFYCGRFALPLSLIVVILIGVQLGRTTKSGENALGRARAKLRRNLP